MDNVHLTLKMQVLICWSEWGRGLCISHEPPGAAAVAAGGGLRIPL